MSPDRRQQSARLLAACALLILTALLAGAWLDARPVRLDVHPTPAPGISPSPSPVKEARQ